jgi:phosphohistidine phosphatase
MAIRGEPKAHWLYLMRHADADDGLLGTTDAARQLSRLGRAQARATAEFLTKAHVDLVLSSNAIRARQTTELLGLPAPVRYLPRLYNAGARQVMAELSGVDDQVRTVLVVGHAPGLPSVAYSLANGHSDSQALARIRPMFPPATLVGLEFAGGWSELTEAKVFLSRLAFVERGDRPDPEEGPPNPRFRRGWGAGGTQ